MRFNYRTRATLFSAVIFAAFATAIVIFHHNEEKRLRTEALYSKMEGYNDQIDAFICEWRNGSNKTDSLFSANDAMPTAERFAFMGKLLPDSLRFTVILTDGTVVFDNEKHNGEMENHFERPEIVQARISGTGFSSRNSATIGREMFYFAKAYPDYFVRTALPYEIKYRGITASDSPYLYVILALSLFAFLAVFLFTDRLTKSLQALQNFVASANEKGNFDDNAEFPQTELGELGEQIKTTFRQIERYNREAKEEREKLLSHFSHSEEGVAFFNERNEYIYANSHFVQLLNGMLDEPTFIIDSRILEAPELTPVKRFVAQKEESLIKYKVEKENRHFEVRVQRFPDGSFEIVLTNITKTEQNRRLKYEMTNSIAHELRTPVSCIRGYIETLLSGVPLTEEKRTYFLQRSYSQLLRLSELISDVSTINKLEEAGDLYPKDSVRLHDVVAEVYTDLEERLKTAHMTLKNRLPEDLTVYGNYSLLYSIIRNLTENSIKYAGDGSTIEVLRTMEDDNFHYFIFSDNGVGVKDKANIDKIFDRFYRMGEGRSRSDGGSGLGLSIVKNAVLFHGGEIQAKERMGGGLEIFFSIAKAGADAAAQETAEQ